MILYQGGGPTQAAVNQGNQQPVYTDPYTKQKIIIPDIHNQYESYNTRPQINWEAPPGYQAAPPNDAQVYATKERMNPNNWWMAGPNVGEDAAVHQANFHNTVIGAALPVPGLNKLQGVKGLSKFGVMDDALAFINKKAPNLFKNQTANTIEAGSNFVGSNETTGSGWLSGAYNYAKGLTQ